MRFFKRFFGQHKNLNPVELSGLKTDMHSHILPGIDDGAKNLEESIALIKELKALGYSKLIATPHTLMDHYPNTKTSILNALELVKKEVTRQQINIDIEASSEYFLDSHFIHLIEKNELLAFSNNYILFELSFLQAPKQLHDTVFKLQLAGYKPVLAHVERYAYWHDDLTEIHKLKDKGVFFQLNFNALDGYYQIGAQKMAHKLIDLNYYDFIATDAHHIRHLEILKNTLRLPYLHKLMASNKLLNAQL